MFLKKKKTDTKVTTSFITFCWFFLSGLSTVSNIMGHLSEHIFSLGTNYFLYQENSFNLKTKKHFSRIKNGLPLFPPHLIIPKSKTRFWSPFQSTVLMGTSCHNSLFSKSYEITSFHMKTFMIISSRILERHSQLWFLGNFLKLPLCSICLSTAAMEGCPGCALLNSKGVHL